MRWLAACLASSLLACGPRPPAAAPARGERGGEHASEEPPRFLPDPSIAIELDESDDRPPALPDGPLRDALDAYEAGRFVDAAAALELLVRDRDPSADDAELAAARHFLAKALHRMGQPLAALAVFEESLEARGESGPYFLATLPWLIRIAGEMPEPYLARLARYADVLPEEAPDSTLLLVARAALESGRLDRAEALAARVRASSPQWPAAQRLLADVAVRAGRPHEAARVARASTELSGESAYRRQQRDLAWLALGQLYLSWASRQHDRPAEASRATVSALVALEQVDPRGFHGPDALITAAWAARVLDEDDRAAAYLARLPEEAVAAAPEVSVLRAAIALEGCRPDVIARELRALISARDRLAAEEWPEREEELAAHLAAVIAGAAGADPGLSWRLRRAAAVERQLRQIAWIDAQARRLAADRSVSEPLRALVELSSSLARALAVTDLAQLGGSVRARLDEDVGDALAQLETIRLESEAMRESCAQRRSSSPSSSATNERRQRTIE